MITKKLKETYQFIRRYIVEHGMAPTEREIADGIGITSRGVAHRYVHKLVDAGFLTITADKKRNIRLRKKKDRLNSVLTVVNTEEDRLNIGQIMGSDCFAVKRGNEFLICKILDENKANHDDMVAYELDGNIYIDPCSRIWALGGYKWWGLYQGTLWLGSIQPTLIKHQVN